MTYSNGEVYDGQWLDDLRHGYGILEKYISFYKEKKGISTMVIGTKGKRKDKAITTMPKQEKSI